MPAGDAASHRQGRGTFHDVMQVCRRGHMLNTLAMTHPDRNVDACDRCGAETIMQCEHCAANIRGVFHDAVAGVSVPTGPPLCCHKCGAPYPWTEARLAEAQAFVYELSALSERDQRALAEAYEAVLLRSPRLAAALTTITRVTAKVGEPAATILHQFSCDVSGESGPLTTPSVGTPTGASAARP
jgi:hypothetical protein